MAAPSKIPPRVMLLDDDAKDAYEGPTGLTLSTKAIIAFCVIVLATFVVLLILTF